MSLGEEFKTFTAKRYTDQAIAFLNAYWDEVNADREAIWDYTHQFIVLDHEKGKEGCDLDEFNAHRFLEKLGETKTVKQMRDELREIDMDFNKRMALIEYYLWSYHKTVSDFVSRPQGGVDPEELAQAQRLLDEVKASQEIAIAAAEEARLREEEAVEKEKPFKIAQEELQQALDEQHRQEEEYATRCSELEARSQDSNLGVVQRNKASNELAQLKAQDPLPLRQAKITTEAAERKADKARAPFKDARERAEMARAEADRTVDVCNEKFEEAEAYLREVMSKPSSPHGQIWWFERELEEARKYMPTKKR